MLEVAILDLGINNLKSIKQAFADFADVKISTIANGKDYISADLLVLPGVGSYGAAMENIKSRGFDLLINQLGEQEIKILGVCLGMQLLCAGSEESPNINGLGLLDVEIKRLPTDSGEKVPHMGWNSVTFKQNKDLRMQPHERDFYFVHSYGVLGENEFTLATSKFGNQLISSALISKNIAGFQFHPEKSSNAGTILISEVIKWANA